MEKAFGGRETAVRQLLLPQRPRRSSLQRDGGVSYASSGCATCKRLNTLFWMLVLFRAWTRNHARGSCDVGTQTDQLVDESGMEHARSSRESSMQTDPLTAATKERGNREEAVLAAGRQNNGCSCDFGSATTTR